MCRIHNIITKPQACRKHITTYLFRTGEALGLQEEVGKRHQHKETEI